MHLVENQDGKACYCDLEIALLNSYYKRIASKEKKTFICLKEKYIIYFKRTFNAHLAHVIVATRKSEDGIITDVMLILIL